MKNILIISPIGLSEFLLPRLSKDPRIGTVFFCILDPSMSHIAKGAGDQTDWQKVEVITDYMKAINESPPSELLVVIDDIGMGFAGKKLRELGYKVIGGSPMADKIEDDRDYATNMMKQFMEVPETYSFQSFDDALTFAKAQPKEDRFVFKPNDSTAPKECTYVAHDISDLVSAMSDFKKEWKYKESFQLQRFLPGEEMDFNAYFNGKEWLPGSMIYYFENKPVMNGDIGPATGGAVAVEYSRKNEGQFFDILEKMKPMLIEDGYVGQLAINCIISEDDKKPYFLEFCGRFGYPSLPADITLLEDNGKKVYDLFLALAEGTMPTLFPTNKIAATIVVGINPYPYSAGADCNKYEPISWDKKWDTYFFPYYVMFDEKKMVSAGISGQVLQVTCCDATLDGAVAMLYDTYMPTLKLKDKLYRTDLGESAKKRMKQLHNWGII